MSQFFTLKSIACRWRHFKFNICCAHHKPVALHGHISSPRSLHPGTSHEKHDSKKNNIKCPSSPTNIGTDSHKPSSWKRLTGQTSLLWRGTETTASTCKGPLVQQNKGLRPAKLEASQDLCCRKDMAVHVSTDAGIRGSQGTASLRSTISAEEVWWCGLPYPTPKNSTGAHPRQL